MYRQELARQELARLEEERRARQIRLEQERLEQEKFYIGTTRFTNQTFQENKKWREKHNWEGCIYGLNKRICHSRNHCIPKEALIYIIEMNIQYKEIKL